MKYIPAKIILSTVKNPPEKLFGTYYGFNLYRGCSHGCIYCDTRSDCYRIGDLSDVRVKKDALHILEKELKSKRKKGTIGTGSMNDPYMPIEKKSELVRGALKLISKYKFGVHVITKSDLVVRDIDLLKDISKVYAAVSFTITTIDDELSKKIEPGAPVSSRRFEAMKKLSDAGIYTGVTLLPTLPYLTDSKENIISIIRRAKKCGAKYITFRSGMTLRSGNREYYYDELDRLFPNLRKAYEKRFGEKYICDAPNSSKLCKVFSDECEKLGIENNMKFYEEIESQCKLF